jgi:hypothetical protein
MGSGLENKESAFSRPDPKDFDPQDFADEARLG